MNIYKKQLVKLFSTFSLALSCVFVLLLPDIAHAGYLDPGSGSTLVQGIIAFIATFKRVWINLLSGIKNIFNNAK